MIQAPLSLLFLHVSTESYQIKNYGVSTIYVYVGHCPSNSNYVAAKCEGKLNLT